MVVGVCRIELTLPGNDSLKGKRSVVRRVVDRVRARFHVSIAEVDAQDVHRKAVLGMAVVSSSSRHANTMIDEIAKYVESVAEVPVTHRSMELLHVSGDGAADEGDLIGAWADFEDAGEDPEED